MLYYLWKLIEDKFTTMLLCLLAGIVIIFFAVFGTWFNIFIFIWDAPYIIWTYKVAKRRALREVARDHKTDPVWMQKGMYILFYVTEVCEHNRSNILEFRIQQSKKQQNDTNTTTS